MQHTHLIANRKTAQSRKLRRAGFEVTGPATVTKDGSPAPFAASTLSVNILGGTSVEFSNITLQFAGGATGHFGTAVDPRRGWQPDHVHGPGRWRHRHDNRRRDAPQSDDQPVLGGAGRQRIDQRFRKPAVSVRGGAGRKPSGLLQSPSSPKATVDFVNGPGLYGFNWW